MPVINPELVPTIAPGRLFDQLTTNGTLAVRWLTPVEPVFYEILNRPSADLTLRQLILAKAVDTLNGSLGHTALFPFIIQARISSGSGEVDLPPNWIWDLGISLPKKWENLRLAKIKRISGTNTDSDSYSGKLRLIFTASQQGSNTEVALVYADYNIASTLTYQVVRLTVVTTSEESVAIDSSEAESVGGFIIFQTLDTDETTVQAFLTAAAPPDNTADADNDGLFDDPAEYELVDSVVSDPSGSFNQATINHGTGMLTVGAYNPIPSLDSDVQSWLDTFNYPFDADANRTSSDNIEIPLGLFREFDICVPAGDEETGNTDGLQYPVWISRVLRVGATAAQLRFFFATYNVTDTDTGGAPSTEAIEFATLDLTTAMVAGQRIAIVPIANLQLKSGDLWMQGFGRGHVVLSAKWGSTDGAVTDFFNTFALISDDPADTPYSTSSTRVSSFGLSRVPKTTPTVGQAQALLGSTARRETPVHPSVNNRYVTEDDQGKGDRVDLESVTGINPHIAIEQYGYKGALCHRIVSLTIDSTKVSNTDDEDFYDDEILPRLTELYGRAPQFGDMYHNGTRVLFYNGDTWQSLG